MTSNRTRPALIFAAGVLSVCVAGQWTGHSLAADQNEGSDRPTKSEKDDRVSMLNVLWFKPDGGAEKYDKYLKAAGPFVAKHGGKVDVAYVPEANILGKFDADLIFFVEWPNQKSFLNFVQDPGYLAISHLRNEAIRDSLLIRCRKKT